MKPRKFLWWGSEIKDFDQMCRDRNWVEREEIENYLIELLPSEPFEPTKIRLEVPTDYWSDLENPHIDSAGEIDLIELEGQAYYDEKKIEFKLVAKMMKDERNPEIDWKVWKMQKKNQ